MVSASPRSICHLRTEPVWSRGFLEEAELDPEPDRADDRDKPNQQPPAGLERRLAAPTPPTSESFFCGADLPRHLHLR